MTSNRPNTVAEVLQRMKEDRVRATGESGSSGSADPEVSVKEIWVDVLGVADIGDDENIFDLGGDSIHIVQIASRVRDVFGVEISFGEFFDSPTIAGLTKLIRDSRRDT